MNAPIDLAGLDADHLVSIVRVLVDALEDERTATALLRREVADWKAKALHEANLAEALYDGVPKSLVRAVRDLLGRLDARDDVGAATRLAVQAVRQELQAATSSTTTKEKSK